MKSKIKMRKYVKVIIFATICLILPFFMVFMVVHSHDSDIGIGTKASVYNIDTANESQNRMYYGEFEFSCVEELRHADLSVGDKVSTAGYYYANDSGGANYNIDASCAFGGVALDCGYFANPEFENGIVNVKQIGAVGDGIADDSALINAALNSGYSSVFFPTSEYACNSHINMNTSGVSVNGNGSKLITNDNFYADYVEWFFSITANNVCIDGLGFECRETHTHRFKTQMGIINSDNISIRNCNFNIPHDVIADDPYQKTEYTNLDIYSNCNNITIDSCQIVNYADAYAGLCCMIRDLYGQGSSNIVFSNNTCVHKGKDEIFGVFSNVIGDKSENSLSDVVVTGNSFVQTIGNYSRNVGITLGVDNNQGVNNFTFTGNQVEIQADCLLFKIGSTSSGIIANNTMICSTLYSDLYVSLFGIEDESSNIANIVVKDNDILVDKSRNDKLAITRGNVTLGDNRISYK